MTIYHPTDRQGWLKLRHRHISSTESCALFGFSPYATAFEIGVEKRQPEPSEFEDNERMTWGRRLQDAISFGVAEDYGVLVRPIIAYVTAEETKMGASFDYEITGTSDIGMEDTDLEQNVAVLNGKNVLRSMFLQHGPGILEIKNVDSLVWKNEWKETEGVGREAPEHIEIQLQHQLECLGYNWGVIGVLVGGNRTEMVIRERDREVGQAIRNKVDEFWSNLDKGILPPIELPADAAIIRKLYNYSEPGKIIDLQDNSVLHVACNYYNNLGKEIKTLEGERDSAMANIIQIIGDAERCLAKGFTISATNVAETPISYTRKAYRMVRVTPKKEKKNAT